MKKVRIYTLGDETFDRFTDERVEYLVWKARELIDSHSRTRSLHYALTAAVLLITTTLTALWGFSKVQALPKDGNPGTIAMSDGGHRSTVPDHRKVFDGSSRH
jgi:hypothetical protein